MKTLEDLLVKNAGSAWWLLCAVDITQPNSTLPQSERQLEVSATTSPLSLNLVKLTSYLPNSGVHPS